MHAAPPPANFGRVPPSGGEPMLRGALKRLGVSTRMSAMYIQWPLTKAYLERLAWYVTDELPHPSGERLLDVLINNGLTWMAIRQDQIADSGGHDVLLAFVAGTLQALPALGELTVVGRSGPDGDEWEPLAGTPLGTWRTHHAPISVSFADPHGDFVDRRTTEIRAMLVNYLLTPADVALLRGNIGELVSYPYA